jgi:hypothetical protein
MKLERCCSLAWFTALLLACRGDDRLKWTEDVLLQDGRTVTLTRYQEFKGPHYIGEPPTDSYYWFEFKHPDTGERVRWETKREPGTVALLIHGRQLFLLTRPRFGSGDRQFDCPNPPYLLYRYEAASWTRIELASIPFARVTSNMTFAASDRVELIRKSNNHLGIEVTARPMYQFKPWVMDFKGVKQTFGPINCSRMPDELIVDDRGRAKQ